MVRVSPKTMAIILPFSFPPSAEVIKQVETCVQNGGVVAVPTDSFYALAVGVFQPAALKRLQAIKADRDHKPFPVLISDPDDLDQVSEDPSDVAQKLMKQFWPGLLTILFKAKPYMLPALKGEAGIIGVRQPDAAGLCKILSRTGPLTGTSANATGDAPAQSAEQVMEQLGSDIDLILDGGPTPGGEPSTVIQLEPDFQIIRHGAISQEALEKALQ
ncbi:MAG: L-threonylcarbamoyladenylate synthase [Nitrospirota bacterium]|nr:L-threonylcarbamoyladenylate synthase [Nitrospirota bacterium]MDH5588019.1 L-threonylcarbamoyladenylate synthase [Nitrospirota bacterium]MDH5776341.1 L-threonylcarbamoyladenylate synthase [Nitrospirota bacterium]